jgi:signal transduction histidine kinase/CheY-like chemotaxis protein
MDAVLCVLSVCITIVNTFSFLVDRGSSHNVEQVVVSEESAYIFWISFTSTVPLVIDLLCGLSRKDYSCLLEQLLLVLATNLMNVLFCFHRNLSAPRELFFALFNAQCVIITAVLLNGITKSKSGLWTAGRVRLGFAFYAISQIYFGVLSQSLMVVLNVFFAISVCFFGVGLAGYMYFAVQAYRCRKSMETDLLPVFCNGILISFQGAVGIGCAGWGAKRLQDSDVSFISYLVAITCATAVLVAMLPGRCARCKLTEMEQSLDFKRSFIRYIGHEIRTPLNISCIGLDILLSGTNTALVDFPAASGRTQLASGIGDSDTKCGASDLPQLPVSTHGGRRYLGKDVEADQVLSEVRCAIDHATSILNHLLLYDKLDTDTEYVEWADIHVKRFVESTMAIFAIQAAAKDINFQMLIADGLPILRGDEPKLRQVLCVLASNAIKFTPKYGHVTLSVCSINSGGQQSPHLEIQFVDTGVGIDKDHMQQLFNNVVHFDADLDQYGKGTGLGLYITRALVELHHGTVTVHSNGYGTGSTFIVSLPFDWHEQEVHSCVVSPAATLRGLSEWLRSRHRQNAANKMSPVQMRKRLRNRHRHRMDSKIAPGLPVRQKNHYDVEVGMPSQAHADALPSENYIANVESVGSTDDGATDGGELLRHSGMAFLSATRFSSNSLSGSSSGLEILSAYSRSTTMRTSRTVSVVGLTALVVDDSKSSLKMVCMLLKKLGYEYVTASDGLEALNRVTAAMSVVSVASDMKPDVVSFDGIDFILMDNCMPNMNGADSCRQIRKLGYHGPIIGLTGHTLEDDLAYFRNAGADHILAKPLDVSALLVCLKNLIEVPLVNGRLQEMCHSNDFHAK